MRASYTADARKGLRLFEICKLSHELLKTAYKVIKLLSIIGFGRVDFRIKSNKMFYITDISTNPHYTLKSSYHFIFEQLGLDYKYLIACLIASSF